MYQKQKQNVIIPQNVSYLLHTNPAAHPENRPGKYFVCLILPTLLKTEPQLYILKSKSRHATTTFLKLFHNHFLLARPYV